MIERIDKKFCVGCFACENVCYTNCIQMIADAEGFLYPKVDKAKCINCGLCEKVCPIIEQNRISNETISDENIEIEKISNENIVIDNIANENVAYACFNKNEVIRSESSSGGIFWLLAQNIISSGGVVFGAAFDDNINLVHMHTDNIEGITKFMGSKYLQSKIGKSYQIAKDFLDNNIKVLFSGTPCQIAGLLKYLGREYDDLLCTDLICHGVPSPKAFKMYRTNLERIYGATTSEISFRKKNEGWKQFSLSLIFNNNTEHKQTVDKDLYLKAFLQNVCLRPSCYNCNFKTLNRQSDITLGDFWGIENIMPEMDDNKGISLVFVNSEKGNLMMKSIKESIIYKEVDINLAVKYNSAAIQSAKYNTKRDAFMKDLDKLPFNILAKKYCSDRIYTRIIRKLKFILKII